MQFSRAALEISLTRASLRAVASQSEHLERYSLSLSTFAGATLLFAASQAKQIEQFVGYGSVTVLSVIALCFSGFFGFLSRSISTRITIQMAAQQAADNEEATLFEGSEDNRGRLSEQATLAVAKYKALYRDAMPPIRRRALIHNEKKSIADPLWPEKRLVRQFFMLERFILLQEILLGAAFVMPALSRVIR